MADSPAPPVSDLLALTAQIVAAHVASNSVPAEALPDLILKVHGALANAGVEPAAEPAPQQAPAVPIKRSIQPDYLICLEDGAKVTMLKRYLRRRFGLEPDEYRAKWGLPADYPMVAPNYAARRSTLAKELGLGRKRTAPDSAPMADDVADDVTDDMADDVQDDIVDDVSDDAADDVTDEGAEDQVFAADIADDAKAGKHTAESVFANFGKGKDAQDGGEEDGEAQPAAPSPKKRGRKPFAQQSMRPVRGRRSTAAE